MPNYRRKGGGMQLEEWKHCSERIERRMEDGQVWCRCVTLSVAQRWPGLWDHQSGPSCAAA